MIRSVAGSPFELRTGVGVDVHRLADGVPLHLAGLALAGRAARARGALGRRRLRARHVRRAALRGRTRRSRHQLRHERAGVGRRLRGDTSGGNRRARTPGRLRDRERRGPGHRQPTTARARVATRRSPRWPTPSAHRCPSRPRRPTGSASPAAARAWQRSRRRSCTDESGRRRPRRRVGDAGRRGREQGAAAGRRRSRRGPLGAHRLPGARRTPRGAGRARRRAGRRPRGVRAAPPRPASRGGDGRGWRDPPSLGVGGPRAAGCRPSRPESSTSSRCTTPRGPWPRVPLYEAVLATAERLGGAIPVARLPDLIAVDGAALPDAPWSACRRPRPSGPPTCSRHTAPRHRRIRGDGHGGLPRGVRGRRDRRGRVGHAEPQGDGGRRLRGGGGAQGAVSASRWARSAASWTRAAERGASTSSTR